MNEFDVLGLEVRDYSQFKSKKNNDEETINRIERTNEYSNNCQKYKIGKPIKTEEDYIGLLDKMYIVYSNYGQTDWMGYGYRHETYVISDSFDKVDKYCRKRFGENNKDYYYGQEYFRYVIKKVSSKEYLINVNKILKRQKDYDDIKPINNNFQTIKMKIVVSEGIPIRMKNGQIEYDGRGELERYYEPEPLDEIMLYNLE